MTTVDTRITPALHPGNVREIDGYDGETAVVLAPTETAFSAAYEGLRKVHDAREKARTNPTWNEAMQVIQTQELADKVFHRVARSFDTTRANLEKGIEHLEGELSRPVESRAAGGIASEVRAHVKGLPASGRVDLVRQAINEGDHIVATAVLGAPAILSGLDPKMQAILTRHYHERHNPGVAKRLKAMVGARDLIEQRAGLIFKELEKAVGMRPDKVKALREAKNASEQAFVMEGR
jgi:hypothetical protein